MKNNLRKKVISYSSLAASAIFAMHEADAQIIYSNPQDIILHGYGTSAEIDLNNDGVTDMVFKIVDNYPQYPGGFIAVEDAYGEIVAVKGIDYPCVTGGESTYMALALKGGKVVKYANNWVYLSDDVALLDNDTYGYATNCQQWLGKIDHYLGLQIGTPPNQNYGWMRLSVNKKGNSVIIKDWAINSVTGQPIVTGQTMKIGEDATSQVSLELNIYAYEKTLVISDNLTNSLLQIEVYNTVGEEVFQFQTSEVTSSRELDNCSGIYFVRIQNGDENLTKQVMIR